MTRRTRRDGSGGRPRHTARIAVPALLLAVALLFPQLLPNRPGNLGSLAETVLPWFGIAIAVLLPWAAARGTRLGIAAGLVPLVAWCYLFVPTLTTPPRAGLSDFEALTLNVGGARTTPEAVAREVIATGADLVALEKVPLPAIPAYEKALADTYPHHATHNTLGLWSRYPLHEVEAMDLGGPWPHAIRAVAGTPGGDTAIYTVRLPSVRVRATEGFAIGPRDAAATELADRIAKDPAPRMMLLGDLNGSLHDRGLASLTHHLEPAQEHAGRGFGFTWPAAFPVVRIDHVLLRGLEATATSVLPDLGSDHRPVLTGVRHTA
ncbi:endonuclease/exonuclease/phosphatase family protein [Streptomyces sp. ISL-43]|uniref:endonuclease/exonuclease/phosphatase family protein n=1 Tax=Streptomyces sp. ISL-43 TaxID=2819183 RepID=UPI001BE91F69|nr:endonuclease/exonuclease/phosphatase family protein [Streptomyces sp. ISL-43]MBT2449246.1 endonuclease/exonuclease/phosphatase family protein [Streptomyces sp. ISL-43]